MNYISLNVQITEQKIGNIIKSFSPPNLNYKILLFESKMQNWLQ